MLPHSALAVVAMIAAVAHAEPASFAEPKALPVIAGLPDPLLSQDGAPVKTKDDWLVKRAPELRRMFQHYEYAARPPPVKVVAEVVREDKAALGAKAMPDVGRLLPSRLGYYIRPGKHAMTCGDWAVWLDYADRWLRP